MSSVNLSKIAQNLEISFVSLLSEYSQTLVEKFNLDNKEVQKLTESFVANNFKLNASSVEKEKKTNAKVEKNSVKCSHVFTKGTKSGETCTSAAKEGGFCARHAKTLASKNDEKEEKKSVVDSAKKNNLQKIVLALNKDINRYWHKESQLVFHSKSNLVVVGKIRENGVFVEELRDEDIELCKKYHFKYETNKEKLVEEKKKKIVDELQEKNIEDALDDLLVKNGLTTSDAEDEQDEDVVVSEEELLEEDD